MGATRSCRGQAVHGLIADRTPFGLDCALDNSGILTVEIYTVQDQWTGYETSTTNP